MFIKSVHFPLYVCTESDWIVPSDIENKSSLNWNKAKESRFQLKHYIGGIFTPLLPTNSPFLEAANLKFLLNSWIYSSLSKAQGGLFRPLQRSMSQVSPLFLTLAVIWRWRMTAVLLQLISLISSPCSLRALWVRTLWTPRITICLQKALSAL